MTTIQWLLVAKSIERKDNTNMVSNIKLTLLNIWDKMDGKKTVYGLVLYAIATVLFQHNIINSQQYQTILDIAVPLGTVGILHRVYKYFQ